MNAAFLLAMGAAMGVRFPRSLRPPQAEPQPDEEGLRRIEAAATKRERRRQKRLAKEAP